MTDDWKERIRSLTYRKTETQDGEFVSLVDMAKNNCDLETCRLLMHTFVSDDDFGVQESVVSALGTAEVADYQQALLEELPRMMAETPQWAEALIERELTHRLSALEESLKDRSNEEREAFRGLAERARFDKDERGPS
jgi:hypothetical protein